MSFHKYLVFILSIFIFTSCATIIKGSKERIEITSNPPGANVYIDHFNKGQTPLSLKLPRSDVYSVRIEKENYQPFETRIERKFNGWIFGNLISGGLIGALVDGCTGATHNLIPNYIQVQLEPKALVNRNDTNSVQKLINADFIFEVQNIDSIPALLCDRNEFFNLFQKAEKDYFILEFAIDKDGIIDPSSFYSDDKYISKIKSQICRDVKFSPGKIVINGKSSIVRTRLKFTFSQTLTEKIPGSNATMYCEKKIKDNQVLYKIESAPKDYQRNVIDSNINFELLLKNEYSGIYIFTLGKFNTFGIINLKGVSSPIIEKQSEIMKFKFRMFE